MIIDFQDFLMYAIRLMPNYAHLFSMPFTETSRDLTVVAAVEINTVANEVYHLNFPDTKLLQKNIQSLTSDNINKIAPDIILMSPPCQPFTRFVSRLLQRKIIIYVGF